VVWRISQKQNQAMRTAAAFAVALFVAGLVLLCWIGATQASEAGESGASDQPRAIILLIGDGMGEAQRTAARWQAVGQGGQLAMDAMEVSGWSRTGSADNAVTDSAAAGTAIATGVKTNNGMVSIDPYSRTLTTILEHAQARGMAVGLVTTVQMVDATPAVFASHVSHRSMMTEIASQVLDHRVDVLLGGGEDEFLPGTETGCYPEAGERTDGRNLVGEAVAVGYTYVCTPTAFAAVSTSTTHLLGLFADEGMTRPFSPTLAQMTQKAIDILSQDTDGFFLMVEGGQIDWACHANDAANAISDTIGFDEAVAVAQAYASVNTNTLVIVTGDHETGGMSVSLSSTGDPGEDGPFYMPGDTPFYVNWMTTTHTAADVPTTAQGVYSGLLDRIDENTYIYDVMYGALRPQFWFPLILYGYGEN
jgi:alkaline phosphatase